jgi:AcrR family transcriptional regulator
VDDIKNFILDKAKERFAHFGYKKTTMDELSRDCKISKRTIYVHFNDKKDLFTNLISREIYKAHQVLFDGIPEISDPLEKLIQLIKTAISFFNEDNFLIRLLNADETLFSACISKKYDAMIRADIIAIVSEIIREGKEQGKFRDVDEKVVAYAGVRLFQAFSYMRPMELLREEVKQDYYTDV